MGSAAKVLDCGIGRNSLFQMLRDHGILMDNNQPYQTFVDRGYFRVVEQKYLKPDGSQCVSTKTLVFQNGLNYILRTLKLTPRKIA
jgi:phage antirepressor YoqD-like protein